MERMNPKFVPLNDNPEAARQFAEWSQSRNSFQAKVAEKAPSSRSEGWQKRYYRGLDMDDKPGVPDHQARLRLKPFVPGAAEPASQAAEFDPDRLEQAVGALVAAVRAGEPFDPSLLTEAGFSDAAADRIVRRAGLAVS